MNRVAWYIAATVALSVLILVGRSIFFREDTHIDSFAVLPFENISGDPQQDYFVEGVHEELIVDLAKIRALRVISRTSVMHY